MARLPSEFQEVEYLESTGTQYIDTGFKPNKNIRFDVEFMILGVISGQKYVSVFGSRVTSNVEDFQLYYYYLASSQSQLRLGTSNGYKTDITLNEDIKYKATYDGSKMNLNNVEYSVTAQPTWNNSRYDLCLFATRTAGYLEFRGRERIFGVKFYLSDTIQRNFVPCYRKSDNVAGMYDLVNDVFYTNAGTGEFVKGQNVYQIQDMKCNVFNNRLPNEFQEVEYVESSGTQYIDSGVALSGEPYYEITYKLNKIEESQMGTSRDTASRCTLGTGGQLTYYWGIGNRNLEGASYPEITLDKHTQFIDVYNKKYGIDSNEYSFTGSFTISPSYTLFLFGRRISGYVSPYFKGKLYNAIIKIDNILVRNYIPCYRKADNVIGMYDLVSGVFYTNAGTGTFTKGEDVFVYTKQQKVIPYILKPALPEQFQEVEYVESNAKQYIDTGISINENVLNSGVKFIEKAIFTSVSTRNTANGKNDLPYFFIGCTSGNKAYSGMGTSYRTSAVDIKNTPQVFELDSTLKQFIIDGDVASTYANVDGETEANIFLFDISLPTRNYACHMKLYYCKIYIAGILQRDLVPCYRKSDNVVGLYDLANDVFYTNQGTDEFFVETTDINTEMITVKKDFHSLELTNDLKVDYYGVDNENFTKIYHKNGEVEYCKADNPDENLQKIMQKLQIICDDKNQLDFITTAINALEDNDALNELKTLIKGIELSKSINK